MSSPSCVVIDRATLVAYGMAKIEPGRIRLVGHAYNVRRGVPMVADLRPDVVAMSPSAEGHWWHAIEEIRDETEGGTRVLVVAHSQRERDIDLAHGAGAAGIASSSSTVDEIVSCLRHIAGGGDCWDAPWLQRHLELKQQGATAITKLQSDLLTAVAAGTHKDSLPSRFGISDRQVRREFELMRKKYNVDNNEALIAYAMRSGVIAGAPPL